jgi:two-component system response regulator EvgA
MRVILFDSHPLMLAGLTGVMTGRKHQVVSATASAQDFIFNIIRHKPDLAIFDPMSLTHSELGKLCQLKMILASLKLFAYAGSDSAFFILRSLRMEIQGYLSKACNLSALQFVMSKIEDDDAVVIRPSPENHSRVYQDMALIESLTSREMQVLRYLAAGKNNNAIARELLLSNKTISTYRRNIMNKMVTRNVSDVVDFAVRNGF